MNPAASETCDGLDTDCDGHLPADEQDADGDNVMGCESDCDDSNAFLFPGNENAYCDCAEPNPWGTEESRSAGNCADGVDNDCDGSIDSDPECSSLCAGSAIASTLGSSPVYPISDLVRHLCFCLLPLAVVAMFLFSRKKL